MAKNWSVSEALQVITTGENLGAIKDIGRRFPLFLFFVLHNPLKIIEAFGERVTARTVNKQLEENLNDTEEVHDEDWVETKTELKEKVKKEKVKKEKGEEKKKEKKEKKKVEEEEKEEKPSGISSEAEIKKMEKGEMPKDRLITDDEVIQLHEREKEKEDKKDKVEKGNKAVKDDREKEVKKQEKISDEQVEEDDLDFSVEDLLEE